MKKEITTLHNIAKEAIVVLETLDIANQAISNVKELVSVQGTLTSYIPNQDGSEFFQVESDKGEREFYLSFSLNGITSVWLHSVEGKRFPLNLEADASPIKVMAEIARVSSLI